MQRYPLNLCLSHSETGLFSDAGLTCRSEVQKSRAVFVPRKRYHVLVESGDILLKKKIAELLRYYRELKRAETGERERLTIVRSRKKRSIEINHFVREFLETTEDYDKALGTSELAKVLHLYYFERKDGDKRSGSRAYLSESSVKRMKEIIVTDVMLLCAAKNLLTYEQILQDFKMRGERETNIFD